MARHKPAVDLPSVLVDLIAADSPEPVDRSLLAVLDAASELLAAHGLRRWTIDDVAGRAGVGRATVYRRFSGRDEMVRAAITRDARRFFAAVSEAVAAAPTLEDKVVEGFLAGLRLARASPLASLLAGDPEAAMSLLTSEALLEAAVTALVERYSKMGDTVADGAARTGVEEAAETLVRLGLSFLLNPGPSATAAGGAQDHIRALIRPLLATPLQRPGSGVGANDPSQWDTGNRT